MLFYLRRNVFSWLAFSARRKFNTECISWNSIQCSDQLSFHGCVFYLGCASSLLLWFGVQIKVRFTKGWHYILKMSFILPYFSKFFIFRCHTYMVNLTIRNIFRPLLLHWTLDFAQNIISINLSWIRLYRTFPLIQRKWGPFECPMTIPVCTAFLWSKKRAQK